MAWAAEAGIVSGGTAGRLNPQGGAQPGPVCRDAPSLQREDGLKTASQALKFLAAEKSRPLKAKEKEVPSLPENRFRKGPPLHFDDAQATGGF